MRRLNMASVGAASVLVASMALASGACCADALSAAGGASGIDLSLLDRAVRPQDDFNGFVNGLWVKRTEIPVDKTSIGAFDRLYDQSLDQLRVLIEETRAPQGSAMGVDASGEAQKIADFYASFMDEARLETLGASPLKAEFKRIDQIHAVSELPAVFEHLQEIGVTVPFALTVHPDHRDASRYIVDLQQDGLGLPDRDYYLSEDETFADIRAEYLAHIGKMLSLLGVKDAARAAQEILSLETMIAKVQWTKVENRDPVKQYNLLNVAALGSLAPHFNWAAYLGAAGLSGKVTALNVSQPSYLSGYAKLLTAVPLPVWRQYLRWQLISSYAPYLSKPFVDARFAFYGTVLQGVPENRARWKRGVSLLDQYLGEALGKRYVARYFPPASKQRIDALVRNLLEAYRLDIDSLDWMSSDTKREAHQKLAAITPKIGYPSRWRDYGALVVHADDLAGNVMRASIFEARRNLAKIGAPVDREEWGMTPQTINAYYNPEMNEIVFPAAILQPPFFDPAADDAVNYGAIGAVIGHEISHGFDDEGAQYDGSGNLRDWWTSADHAAFKAKSDALIAQYNAFEPVAGFHLNGALTLGENIADNSGLAIAFKAYRLSLQGKGAPVLDALTGEQRFYIGFAQVWREKARDNYMIELIKSDPHSMASCRVLGTVANQPGFFAAFDVHAGDKMYRAPAERVEMW